MSRAPGPRGWGSVRAIRHFLRDPLDYQCSLRERFGDVVRTRAGPIVFHSLYEPRWIRHVLVENPARYTKRGVLDDLAPVLREGMLRSEGARWRARRQALSPAFAPRAQEPVAAAADACAAAWSARFEEAARSGSPLEVSSGALELALGVVGRALFGVDLAGRSALLSRAVARVSELAYRRARALAKLPLSFPTRANRAYLASVRELDQVVRADLLAPRAGGPDVLAPLRALVDPQSGAPIGPEDLRDEAMTLLLAGHETTATTLAWSLDLFARHPEVQQRAREEALGALPPDAPASLHALARLPYLDAAVSETLRLYPPGWILMRRAEEEDEIAGYALPRHSLVTLPVYALHRHPRLWPQPERFDPERFLGASERDPLAFLPFGAGERRCFGEAMARTELRVVLARILARFELRSIGPPPAPEPRMTLRPRSAVRVGVQSLASARPEARRPDPRVP